MGAIFKKECRCTRRGLLIWSLIVGLTAYLGILEYPVLEPYSAMITETMSLIPKPAQLVFGVYHVNLGDTAGYYIVMYYWCGLIVFSHAAYVGASMMGKEQRDHTAEYLFTKPFKRSRILAAKVCAGFVNILAVAAVTTAMFFLALLPMKGGADILYQVLICGVGMFLTQCVLMSIGFLCSAVGRSYKTGVLIAMSVLAFSYCLMFVIQYLELPGLRFLSPLTFFAVSQTMEKGISLLYLLLAAGVAGLSLLLTNWMYERKVMPL